MCNLLLCSCQQTTSNPRFYDEGVSQELAILRKQEIKELKYKLYFSIPEQKSVPVNGEIAIEFNLDAPQEIILDFREKPEKIKSVSVNGQTARYEFHNEHIILPEKNIVEGKNNITIKFIAGFHVTAEFLRQCPYLQFLTFLSRIGEIFLRRHLCGIYCRLCSSESYPYFLVET